VILSLHYFKCVVFILLLRKHCAVYIAALFIVKLVNLLLLLLFVFTVTLSDASCPVNKYVP